MRKPKLKKPKARFRHKHPIIYYAVLLTLMLGMSVGIFGMLYLANVLQDVPEISEDMLHAEPTSNMYDNNGYLIWSETENRRDYIEYDDIPELYIELLTAIEDQSFYEHRGFSVRGISNAGYQFMMEQFGGERARGGSTIDQQLIKNTVFMDSEEGTVERTVRRKIQELWLSLQLNENFTKEQILEWYVNRVAMGENAYGVNTASITYYGRPLSEWDSYSPENLAKVATLAGIVQAPTMYNLYDNPERAKDRRDTVLMVARDEGRITHAQFEAAVNVDIAEGLQPRHWRNNEVLAETLQHSTYIDAVLQQVRELGYDLDETPLQIHTHLDRSANTWLKHKLDERQYYESDDQQGAATVIDVETGIVLAISGARFNDDPYAYNRATQRTRSTGSAIKPFIAHGPALEYAGVSTNMMLDTSNYVYPGTTHIAYNYGGWEYGMVDFTETLRQSYNTSAIRLLDDVVGQTNAKRFMRNMNMDVKDVYGAGDALGLDLSTLDMANGMATFSRYGMYQDPVMIDTLVFPDGSELEVDYDQHRAMKESTAFTILSILDYVAETNEFAEAADIPIDASHSYKTGSVGYPTHMYDYSWMPERAIMDSWVVGATSHVAVAVWSGYDTPMEPGHYMRDEERDSRLSLYSDIMMHYASAYPNRYWVQPDTVTTLSGVGADAFYRPNDFDADRFKRPEITDVMAQSENMAILNGLSSITIVDDMEVASRAPTDYMVGYWRDLVYMDGFGDILERFDRQDSVYSDIDLPDYVFRGDIRNDDDDETEDDGGNEDDDTDTDDDTSTEP